MPCRRHIDIRRIVPIQYSWKFFVSWCTSEISQSFSRRTWLHERPIDLIISLCFFAQQLELLDFFFLFSSLFFTAVESSCLADIGDVAVVCLFHLKPNIKYLCKTYFCILARTHILHRVGKKRKGKALCQKPRFRQHLGSNHVPNKFWDSINFLCFSELQKNVTIFLVKKWYQMPLFWRLISWFHSSRISTLR